LAYLIDSAVLLVAALVLLAPFAVIILIRFFDRFDSGPDGGPEPGAVKEYLISLLLLELGAIVVGLALRYVYDVEMFFRTGQTLGKKIMKLRVVPLDPEATLTRRHAVRRWLVTQGAGFAPGLSYVDGLWQLWDKPYQQCLHDKWAKTVVVKVPA
jgi:uncharacterized RDD family membrane protein YckC